MTSADFEYRKPRIAIMGEFSAGKSTLSNLLLGHRVLPEKVTATRLPPVWMKSGIEAPCRKAVDGQIYPVDLDKLEDVPLEETLYVKLSFDAEVLDHCDLLDFPGISDPNMASEVWERMLGEVDGVIWCTHATQAWRQSEASAWGLIPEKVRENSILLITRFDKLTNDRDKERVLKRIKRETAGLFADACPISLTQALAAGEDETLLEASGAIAFFGTMNDIVGRTALLSHVPEPEAEAPEWAATAAPSAGLPTEPAVLEFDDFEVSTPAFAAPKPAAPEFSMPEARVAEFAEPAQTPFEPKGIETLVAEAAGKEDAQIAFDTDAASPAFAEIAPEIEEPAVEEPEFDEPTATETAAEAEDASDTNMAGALPSGFVMPRRVKVSGVARTPRPARPSTGRVVRDPVFEQASDSSKTGGLDHLRDSFREGERSARAG
ncbi:MAG: dynamin family protein [Albidovulum sp.]